MLWASIVPFNNLMLPWKHRKSYEAFKLKKVLPRSKFNNIFNQFNLVSYKLIIKSSKTILHKRSERKLFYILGCGTRPTTFFITFSVHHIDCSWQSFRRQIVFPQFLKAFFLLCFTLTDLRWKMKKEICVSTKARYWFSL